MGLFGKKKDEYESEKIEEPEIEEEEEKDFDVREAIKGMTEKQLLKMLVVIKFEEQYASISDSYEDLIDIAKEE